MPAKNSIKQYLEGGYYHIYNRGISKENIFVDDQDYRVFLNLLKTYLSSPSEKFTHPLVEATGSGPINIRILKNFFKKVSLLSYCLMPNHFHLLIQQTEKNNISLFMKKLFHVFQ